MQNEKAMRDYLASYLRDANAHMMFAEAVADFPMGVINTKAPHVEYTFWHLVEHIRRTQWDIVDFSKNPNYKGMKWPDDYWPAKDAKATPAQWKKSVAGFTKDLADMIELVQEPKTDLFAKIPWGDGQTIFREALLIIDHNAYHVGELAILRQVTSTWPKKRR